MSACDEATATLLRPTGHRRQSTAVAPAQLDDGFRDASTLPDRLAEAASRLARRNEALEDFAALVAHELKAPLQAALASSTPVAHVADALELIDSLLVAAQGCGVGGNASLTDCIGQAAEDLDDLSVRLTEEDSTRLPLHPAELRAVLRNLIRNAAAASAKRVEIHAECQHDSWVVTIDDDGTGIDQPNLYAHGTGLGLRLCQRIASRGGGSLELRARGAGGTRALLLLPRQS